MRRAIVSALGALTVSASLVLATASPASAHPLGNVSVNHYAGLVVGTDGIRIDYVLDLAELPTVRERQRIDADGDDELDDRERVSYERDRCRELAGGLELVVGGRAAEVRSSRGALSFLDGTAGLQTLRLECDLRAALGVTEDATEIELSNTNTGGRGWNEVTAVGDEVSFDDSSVPEVSVSSRLSDYPDGDVLDVRGATLIASPGGPPAPSVGATPFGERARVATDRFTTLIAADEVTVPLVATSLVVAMLFGALHSLAPGHGKSVIAAYLLGQRRNRRLAFVLGATVAVTHTASVLVFGVIVWLTESAAPEDFYPAFGVLSGSLFVALGIVLLRQVIVRHRGGRTGWARPAPEARPIVAATAGPPAAIDFHHGHVAPAGHDHDDHGHDDHHHAHPTHGHHHHGRHGHDHGDGWHEHEHVDLGAVASGELGWRGVVLPGLAGGVIPSPSALLVFLGGLALGRAWFGVGLVLGYGVGIAITLVTAGWLLARAGDRMSDGDALARFPTLRRAATYLPVVTALLVIAGGLHIALRAAI